MRYRKETVFKNNRWMSKAKCAVCGETKTRFVTAAEAQKIQEGN